MSGASVVITNFNQARFVGQAIDSALAQTAPLLEVIVVDDGSTDDSPSVIGRYGNRIVSIRKENGGQASALNVGVEAARGDFVYFLDADDAYAPQVIEGSIDMLRRGAVKVHWPVQPIDEAGRLIGRPTPIGTLASGDRRADVRQNGPGTHRYPPSSANAAARDFLATVLPIPEAEFRTGADMFVSELAAFAGPLAVAPNALTFYRRHDANDSERLGGGERVARWVRWYDACAVAAADHCRREGLKIDTRQWADQGWPARLQAAVGAIRQMVPAGERFLLIDDDAWGLTGDMPGAMPFPAHDGVYWGPPADDEAAIAELARCRREGVAHVAVLWNADWWLDHYRAAFSWVEQRSTRRYADGALTLFSFR